MCHIVGCEIVSQVFINTDKTNKHQLGSVESVRIRTVFIVWPIGKLAYANLLHVTQGWSTCRSVVYKLISVKWGCNMDQWYSLYRETKAWEPETLGFVGFAGLNLLYMKQMAPQCSSTNNTLELRLCYWYYVNNNLKQPASVIQPHFQNSWDDV